MNVAIPASIAAAKSSAQTHKQTLTKIHRIIDTYEQGRGASACMDEIKKAVGRKAP